LLDDSIELAGLRAIWDRGEQHPECKCDGPYHDYLSVQGSSFQSWPELGVAGADLGIELRRCEKAQRREDLHRLRLELGSGRGLRYCLHEPLEDVRRHALGRGHPAQRDHLEGKALLAAGGQFGREVRARGANWPRLRIGAPPRIDCSDSPTFIAANGRSASP